jgi:hypothetical protein
MKSLVTPNLKENPMDPLPQDNGNFGSIGKFVFYFLTVGIYNTVQWHSLMPRILRY